MNLTDFSQKLRLYAHITPPVLLCIGSTKVLTDSFGPLVGSLLSERYAALAYVYGTLRDPIHALNLNTKLTAIKKRHPYAKIVAVDSFVAKTPQESLLAVDGGIKPGLASGKNLPLVGDLSLIGCTQRGTKKSDLGHIAALAQKTADLLLASLCDTFLPPRKESTLPYEPFAWSD